MNQPALVNKPLPPQDAHRSPQLTDLPSFSSREPGILLEPAHPRPPHSLFLYRPAQILPLTPTTPLTPLHPSFSPPDQKPKKSNPLNDLIDTEKTYVDLLTGIIRVS